jgi:cytochrome c biogenesis protein CcmG/thiol:disulfide interchange protein DsbE
MFKTTVIFALPTIVLFIFFLSLGENNQYSTENLTDRKLDNFILEPLIGDKKISEDQLKKNDFTLINFFSSWCAPCVVEHEYLLLLKKSKKLKILGVNYKYKQKHALKFLKELGNPYDYLGKDESGTMSIKFGLYGVPESILIDKNLKIIKKYVGPITIESYEQILRIIK